MTDPGGVKSVVTSFLIRIWISAVLLIVNTQSNASENLPPELIAQKEDLLKDRVAIEMKRYFNKDFRRIGHAMRVARYAERIGKKEGGNLAVILPSAYLHDIGIKEAERKHGSSAAHIRKKRRPGG